MVVNESVTDFGKLLLLFRIFHEIKHEELPMIFVIMRLQSIGNHLASESVIVWVYSGVIERI